MERTINRMTDIGADEFYRSPGDFDENDYVNFVDYAMFATAWATKLGDPDYNDIYDLEDNDVIDYNDLSIFCDSWLWVAAWVESEQMMMGMGDGGAFLSESVSPQVYPGGLMLSDISESLEAMPDSLYSKVEKFYSVNPYVPARQKIASVPEILDWLDGLWEQGEIQNYLTYAEYLEFCESIEDSISP